MTQFEEITFGGQSVFDQIVAVRRAAAAAAAQGEAIRRAKHGEHGVAIARIALLYNVDTGTTGAHEYAHIWWDDDVVAVAETGHIEQSSDESEWHVIKAMAAMDGKTNTIFFATPFHSNFSFPLAGGDWIVFTPQEYIDYISHDNGGVIDRGGDV